MKNTQSNIHILNAFVHIIESPEATINPAKISNNRITHVGDALEGYIKDALAGLLHDQSVTDVERYSRYSQVFSWLGNSSNPPDCLIRGGDAIEVKKIESRSADIALNSSYPKNKIYASDSRTAGGARTAEDWDVKDIVYAIGTTQNLELKRLWLIYGDCYAASKEVYEKLFNAVSESFQSSPDLEFQPTNELGRVNKVDPLGITNMRIRGMWHIANPSRLYHHLVSDVGNRQIYLLLREEKYLSFPADDRRRIEQVKKSGFANERVEIRDPDNPAQLVQARMIKYEK